MNKQLKYIKGENGRAFLKKETYNKLVNIKMHKDNSYITRDCIMLLE